jgi:hypothetical protein
VTRSIAREGVSFSDVDGDDACAEELLCLCDFVDEVPDRLSIHLSNLLDREVANVVAMSVPEWCPLPR